jgi:hypothetical protein
MTLSLLSCLITFIVRNVRMTSKWREIEVSCGGDQAFTAFRDVAPCSLACLTLCKKKLMPSRDLHSSRLLGSVDW